MSQQNGVPSPFASIAAHATDGTAIRPAIIPSSHPSNSSGSALQSLPSVPTSLNPSRARTIIPKLSAATTELLARLAGNIRGTTTAQQQTLLKNDKTPSSRNSLPIDSNRNIQGVNARTGRTMRFSSVFIDLPTPPFADPSSVEVETPTQTPVVTLPSTTVSTPTQPSTAQPSPRPSGRLPPTLANIAPKPVATPSISRHVAPQVPAQVPTQIQHPVETQPLPLPAPAPQVSAYVAAQVPVQVSTQAGPSAESRVSPLPPLAPLNLTHTAPQVPARVPAHAHPPEGIQPSPLRLLAPPISSHVAPQLPIQVKPSAKSQPLPSPSKAPPKTPHAGPQESARAQPPAGSQPPSLPSLAPLASLAPAGTIPTLSNTSPTPRPATTNIVKATSAPRQRAVTGNRKSLSKKRKRGKNSDGEDVIRAADSSSDESDFTPTATQTKSGRQVNRPSVYVPEPVIPAPPKENVNTPAASEKSQDIAKKRRRVSRKGKSTNSNCKYCQRGHSAPRNVIVFCDGCNRAWHQFCHDPPIERDVITVKEKEWLCQECNPVEIKILHPTVVRSNPGLAWKPPVYIPIPPPKMEVGGERFPTADRRQFLSGLSHATLVELLLTISDKHPTVPMFPGNMASLPVSKFPSTQDMNFSAATEPVATLPATTDRPTPANPPAPIAPNGIGTADTDAPTQRPRGRYEEISSDEESEYEFQEHRLYPRAGNGVRLSALAEDLDILAEDPACPTFSYAMHGPMQPSIAGRVSA
ncbi:hypothetical protein BJY01DRAFT_215491 [Aspergillus pseudoustus]|uniref:PHD-type domain-containing protein n=1 Tax=Aspergillus pseudoustus TaxID=1810923 RepID=A0ABR4JUB7_9EURO